MVRVPMRGHLDASIARNAMKIVETSWPRVGPWIYNTLQQLKIPVPVPVVGAPGLFPQSEDFGKHLGRRTPRPKLIDFSTKLYDGSRQLTTPKQRFVDRNQR